MEVAYLNYGTKCSFKQNLSEALLVSINKQIFGHNRQSILLMSQQMQFGP